ncbi:MAG: SCP2 sterol-binding domain-containing protein [Candidatus Actinomarina sp.]|jgi:putative sterol carrier protein|uniref:MedDCM-OCT-S38-C2-cds20 n=1 Tax=Candidatus Actinomarina minuta TaxID=1389454 RepID=S5DRJ5_9ACTN|nr:MedDCM-OCT-S38-C2-cds20 [Candidatus Actinomarina minuta]|tara:strand:+ start:1409 stop:1699 length:291 start_codon:yes stop_codon:yes gene_type:complete
MSDLNKDIDEVLKNLKLAKKSLSNVYLNLIDENDDNFFINLDTGEKVQNLKHDNYGLIIKMTVETFNQLKNNEKHPEDLMFEEKIKISGDLKLLQE